MSMIPDHWGDFESAAKREAERAWQIEALRWALICGLAFGLAACAGIAFGLPGAGWAALAGAAAGAVARQVTR